MKQFNSRIILNEKIAEGFYSLKFTWENGLDKPVPGQFLTVRASSGTDPLLRRPFAFSGFENNAAEIIYQNRGKSTSLLTEKQKGDEIDIIAPLGNSFSADDNKKSILIAGGIGLGPILFFHKELLKSGKDSLMIAGFRSSSLIPEELKAIDNIVLCTDDGSLGFKGNTAEYLESIKDEAKNSKIFACGPNIMMKVCAEFCNANNIDCQVSMEQTMACGVGACMGCVIEVNTEEKYARVCKDGPVFDSRIVKWD